MDKPPSPSSRGRRIAPPVLAGVVAVALVTALSAAGALVDFEARSRDYLVAVNGGARPRPDVVAVAFTDDSLRQLGPWPLPRRVHAQLIEGLREAGARVIVFDILLAEARGDADDDALVEAVRRSGRVVLPAVAQLTASTGGVPVAVRVDRPFGGLLESAASVGAANVLPDVDGVVRSAPLSFDDGGSVLPSLALAAAAAFTGQPAEVTPGGGVRLGQTILPVDRFGRLILEYDGVAGSVPTVDAVRVLAGQYPADFFRDRLVLVGPVAAGVGDRWLTPFSVIDRAPGPGLEVQAAAVQTILNGGWRRAVEPGLATAVVFGLGALAALWAAVAGGLFALVGLLILALGYLTAAWRVFLAGTFVPLFAPLVTLAAGGATAVAVRWRQEERERRRLDNLFGRYVSREVAAVLRDHPELVALGGEEVEVTVLFADLRGFTGLAERVPPGQLVDVLNRYLSAMAEAVFAEGGTLDKYTGDGLMAFFNAPIRQPDHCLRAARAAAGIRRRVEEIRKEIEVPGTPPGVGIGLNAGPALVGNVGTKERLEYTVIGDEVNLAARFKDLAAPGEILAGRVLAERAETGFRWREWGLVEVRGRSQPVRVFTLTDSTPAPAVTPSRRQRRSAGRNKGGDRLAR